jgi:hypothetical protein
MSFSYLGLLYQASLITIAPPFPVLLELLPVPADPGIEGVTGLSE